MIICRLVRFNKRLRAIFNTLAVLLPQIINIILLLILIYYFFAIIGMEIFHDQVEPGCCGLAINFDDALFMLFSNVCVLCV